MTLRLFFSLIFLTSTSLGQTGTDYKKLYDSTFHVGDKIICPDIWFPMHGQPEDYEFFKDSTKKIADFLQRHPKLKVELGGHTDSRGTPDNNKNYSYLKVRYIKNYLVKAYGIDSLRIVAKGYGEATLLISDEVIKARKTKEEKEELHQRNRRTEIKILATD